jgi:hypothetical protein
MAFSTTMPTIPGAAILTSPTSDIGTDYSPDFVWDVPLSGTAPSWYRLYVNGPSGMVLDQWYQASAVCSGESCTVASPVTLGGGNHTWYVQTYNSAGLGPWSDGMAFSTTMPTIPGAAILTSPTSDIGTDYSPDFVWDVPLSGTAPSWYRLYVNGPSGMVLDQWYQASAVCSGESCTVASPVTLGGGSHTWYVQTYNSAGLGPWSDAQNFTVTP